MKKVSLEKVRELLIEMQVDYLTKEEGYEENEAYEEALENVNYVLENIDSIEIEDNQFIKWYVDSYCNAYYIIQGSYIVNLKDGRKFACYDNERASLFEVVELTGNVKEF